MNNPSVPPQYNIQQLQDYIALTRHFTGEEPKELRVTQAFFNFFKESVKQVAANFHLPHEGLKDDEVTYINTKLIPILELKK